METKMENLAALLYGRGDLRMEYWAVREPENGEVLIAVHKAGLCMTDVHLHDAGRVGHLVVTSPLIIGHEFSGVVSKIGPDVTRVKPGDSVTVDSLVACGFCHECKLGHSNVCLHHRYIGFPSCHGGLARFTTVPVRSVHKIPSTMSFEDAALIEPLSVCVNAVTRTDVKLGDNVIVFGAGPIGLMTLQVALAQGASVVCVADIDEDRLRLAQDLGATHVVCFRQNETDARANAQKLRDTIGEDFDVAIECAGVALCLQTAVYAVRPRGVVGVVGLVEDDVALPMTYIAAREIDVRGCICNNYCYPTAIKLINSRKVKVTPIISHRLPLAELPRALDLVRSRLVTKVVIDCCARRNSSEAVSTIKGFN